jgi:signal peptidase I
MDAPASIQTCPASVSGAFPVGAAHTGTNPPPSVFAEFAAAFTTRFGSRFWSRVRRLIALLLLFAVVQEMVVDCSLVPSSSMDPALLPGDLVIINRLAFGLRVPFTGLSFSYGSRPERGDVVALISPIDGRQLVKRIIGMPGDVVEMRQNVLVINHICSACSRLGETQDADGELSLESNPQFAMPHLIRRALVPSKAATFAPITVPAGKYLVLGDNRDASFDSRYFGLIDRSSITGRISRVALSFNSHPDSRWLLAVR